MCELLGLNFKLPVSPSFSFRGFRHRSEGNPHGWGIARYEGKACQILKEAANAQESKLAEFVRDYELFQSRIFIGHVRDATRGGNTLINTHPFKRVFGSCEVVLAHNGTMESLPLNMEELSYLPVGETDSEQLFCSLLTMMAADKIQFTDYQKIEILLQDFNKLGKMNLLFSEGEHFFSYRDKDGHNGLCITERISPFGIKSLQDEDWEVDLAAEKSPGQRGFVIASHPLTKNETWIDLVPGSLIVLKDGSYIYGDICRS
jgi:predicted glutamine amidotransferase